jgi:hypothetical protein
MQVRLDHVLAVGCAAEVVEAMRLLKETLHPCWIQECPVVPVKSASGPDAVTASLLDIDETPLELMSLKPAIGSGMVVRLLNPTGDVVTTAVSLPGLPSCAFRASRVKLDETTTLSCVDLGRERRLELTFKPFEIQTWKIEPC